LVQSEIADKLSIDKLKEYRKLWILKDRKRKDMNEFAKLTGKKSTSEFHASLL
jgi:hypothetical protein